MTRERKVKVNSCPHCGRDLCCRICHKAITFETPFSAWIRTLGGELDSSRTDIGDIDYVVNHYMENWFMTLEVKSRGGKMTQAELDTQSMIAQMLEFASSERCECRTKRGERHPWYYGHHIVTMDGADPRSSKLWINGSQVSLDELEAFLITSAF